eukprot:6208168-Pleurochrysis_carterae.AAC.2
MARLRIARRENVALFQIISMHEDTRAKRVADRNRRNQGQRRSCQDADADEGPGADAEVSKQKARAARP